MTWLIWLNPIAAAIQAVGTLIALGIAIWVPFKIHRNDVRRQERGNRRKGQAIALLVDPLLRTIDGQVEREDILRQEGPRPIQIPEAILALSGDFWLMACLKSAHP